MRYSTSLIYSKCKTNGRNPLWTIKTTFLLTCERTMSDPIERTHAKVAKRAEDLSMTLGIISTVVSIGASAAEPSGLSAFAVFMGISDPPLIITMAPIIATIATVTAVISGGCYIFSKWKN